MCVYVNNNSCFLTWKRILEKMPEKLKLCTICIYPIIKVFGASRACRNDIENAKQMLKMQNYAAYAEHM